MNTWFLSSSYQPLCYHRGSNWGSSTRGTALTRYVFIGCYDSGNNPDSNACRFKVCLNPSKTEPGLVMWWSMQQLTLFHILTWRLWNLCSFNLFKLLFHLCYNLIIHTLNSALEHKHALLCFCTHFTKPFVTGVKLILNGSLHCSLYFQWPYTTRGISDNFEVLALLLTFELLTTL